MDKVHKHRPDRYRSAMDTSSVIWGTTAYRLRDLYKYFELPQLVCVEDGYYDEKDETTLSRDDILTLHILQKTRFYKAVNRNGQEINIPVNLAAKVETVTSEPIRTYHSIQELVNVSAEQVKSVHDHPWLLIQAGDTLRIGEVNNEKGVESLRFSFTSRSHGDVNIPINYKADFQVLPVITRLWLTEVENTLELPVRIRFIDETLQIKTDEDGPSCEDLSTIADIGDVTLQSIYQTEQFVASTKNENRTMVLKIPTHADITVKVGVGMEHEDYTYVEVCQFYHERARLYQLEDVDEECIKIGETDAKVERIYEFVDEFSDEDDGHDYEDMVPKVPSRENRPPLHLEHEEDDVDTSSDESNADYEDYIVESETPPPPIPSRVTSLQQNPNKNRSKNNNQNLCTRMINVFCCHVRTPSENRNNSATKANTDGFEVPRDQGRYVQDSTIRGNPVINYGFSDHSNRVTVEEPDKNNAAMTVFPERLELLTVEEVSQCLRSLKMEQYVEQFRNEQINGGLFVALNGDLLISLGVSSEFHRKKILKFIEGWRPDLNAAQN